jgi:cytidylate kinase
MRYIEAMVNEQIRKWEIAHGEWTPSPTKRAEGDPPPQPVIAICPMLGSGCREVAEILHLRTNYEVFGFKLIDKVAENMNIRKRLIDHLDQQGRSYVLNLIDGLLSGRHVEQGEYFRNLLEVLKVFVTEGGCILLGRGAHFLVEEGAGVRVRVTASRKKRIENLMRYYSVDEHEAVRRMETSDRERADFCKAFYGKELTDAGNFDLVLNMDRLTPETAASSILRALELMRHARKMRRLPVPRVPEDAAALVTRQVEKWDRRSSQEPREVWEEAAVVGASRKRLPVVSVSPQFCAGSRLVAEAIHTRLGYEIFGFRLIDKVAEDMHLSPQILDRLDQRARTAIQSLTEQLLEGRSVGREEYFRSLVRIIRALIVQGGVVLLGRGSCFLTEEQEGLRVRLIASTAKRLENMKDFYGIEGRPALDRLHQGDRDRAEFTRQYYGVDLTDAANFDLILNMDRLVPVTAAEIIQRALEPLLV